MTLQQRNDITYLLLRDEREHEWQVMFEACLFIQRITETYQFCGLLAKCLAGSEPCSFIAVAYEY